MKKEVEIEVEKEGPLAAFQKKERRLKGLCLVTLFLSNILIYLWAKPAGPSPQAHSPGLPAVGKDRVRLQMALANYAARPEGHRSVRVHLANEAGQPLVYQAHLFSLKKTPSSSSPWGKTGQKRAQTYWVEVARSDAAALSQALTQDIKALPFGALPSQPKEKEKPYEVDF